MYKAFVYSVPGSGTRFCMSMLASGMGYKELGWEKLHRTPHNQYYLQDHIDGSYYNVALSDPSVRTVVPLRHPYQCWLTRRYRVGNATDPLHVKQEIMASWWRVLIERSEALEAKYFPVDANVDRKLLLQSVANHLAAPVNAGELDELADAWSIVGSVGVRADRDTYTKTGKIDDEVPTFLDFAVDWYEGVVSELDGLQY